MNFLNKKTKVKIMSQLLLGATVVGLGTNCIKSNEMIITHALEANNENSTVVNDILQVSGNYFLVKNGIVKDISGNTIMSDVKKIVNDISGSYPGNYFFIKNDGTVWGVGFNIYGQLGSGSTEEQKTPIQIPVDDVKDIVSCSQHTFFIKNDGTVYGCGFNFYGQLGLGNKTQQNTPVKIPITDVNKIVQSYNNTIFIKNDGTVYGCGREGYGQFGFGSSSNNEYLSPTLLNISDVKDCIVTTDATIFMKNDGTIWGSGSNNYGNLGLGSDTMTISTITEIPVNDVIYICKNDASYGNGYFFLKKDGSVYTFGRNSYGNLGFASKTTMYTPQKVGIDDVKSIYKFGSNRNAIYALKNDGTVWCWGEEEGQTPYKLDDYQNIKEIYSNVLMSTNSGQIIYNKNNITSKIVNKSSYTLSKINNNLENYGKYGSLSSIIYGNSKYDFNTYKNDLPVAYTKASTTTLSTISVDNSELRLKEIMPNGSMVTVDNYGSVQYYQTLTSSPVDIKTDGTSIESVEYGMIDQTPVVMFYKNDGSVWYFEPTGTTISLKMLPIEQSEFTETTPYLDKNAQIKYFLFEKTNGDLVYFDSNRFEQSVGVNMNDVKSVIPSTSNNSTMYLMNDGTLKYLNGGTSTSVTLPDGISITSMLSNRYAVMSDGYIYAIHNNAIVDTGVLASATQTACNNVLWMKNGSIRQLNTSGSLETLSDVNGKLVKSIVAFDNNNSYILNKDGSTYGVGNLVSKTDLLDSNIEYEEIAGFISNNTSSSDAKLLVMNDGTVYENPSNLIKSTTIYFDGDAINQVKTEFEVSFDTLAQATSAVETAEKMLTQDTCTYAQGLVTLLDEGTEKTALQGRLDTVQATINKITEATTSVVKAETSKAQADKDSAQILVTALPECTQKTDLQNRLNAIVYEKSAIEIATEAVIKAETTKLEVDINSAEVLVTALEDSAEKTALQNRLNTLKEEKLLADATTKVVKAESTVIQSDVDVAQTAINKLKDGIDKTNLQNRLNKIQEEINKNKDTEIEANLIADATSKVEKAESTVTQSDVDIAQLAIDKLKDGTDKTNLQNRLDIIKQKIKDNEDTSTELSDVTKAVEKAETTKTQADVDIAQSFIDKLKDGEDKTALQDRLDNVKDVISNVTEATQAVVKAEGTKSQADIDTAQGLVTALPESTQKTNLQNRLDSLNKIVEDEKAQADLLADATAKVEKTETTKTQADVDVAQTAINKLKPSEEKTALQVRLDKVKEEINTKLLIADATEKVEIAESTKSKVDVSTAQTAVNKLPQGDVRNNLQGRLDKIKEEISQKEEQDAYNNILDDAIAKVEKAESSKTDYNIKVAQNAVNKLPQNEDRKALQDRLDALRTQIEEDKADVQALRVATTKVELAEISVNRSNADSYFINAQTEIDKLKASEGKTALQQRLDTALEKYNNKQNANLINVATQQVRLAEAYKNNRTLGLKYKTQAYETVNKLSECPEKTAFLERLNKLK